MQCHVRFHFLFFRASSWSENRRVIRNVAPLSKYNSRKQQYQKFLFLFFFIRNRLLWSSSYRLVISRTTSNMLGIVNYDIIQTTRGFFFFCTFHNRQRRWPLRLWFYYYYYYSFCSFVRIMNRITLFTYYYFVPLTAAHDVLIC